MQYHRYWYSQSKIVTKSILASLLVYVVREPLSRVWYKKICKRPLFTSLFLMIWEKCTVSAWASKGRQDFNFTFFCHFGRPVSLILNFIAQKFGGGRKCRIENLLWLACTKLTILDTGTSNFRRDLVVLHGKPGENRSWLAVGKNNYVPVSVAK